ncbi:hypothetical protein TURU_101899 [Turdus rufiventris]|nr:hypothetical protein TURU_101899 [Turdus rufiventris]
MLPKLRGPELDTVLKVLHNGLVMEMNHPTAGKIAVPGNLIIFSSGQCSKDDQKLRHLIWKGFFPILKYVAPELLLVPLTGLALFSSESVLEQDGIGFIRHRENFWQLPEGPGVRYSEFAVSHPKPPPLVGQHTVEILKNVLGYEDDAIEELLHTGAVAQHEAILPVQRGFAQEEQLSVDAPAMDLQFDSFESYPKTEQ